MKRIAVYLLLALVGSLNINSAKAADATFSTDQHYLSNKIVLVDVSSSGNQCQSFTPARTPLASYVDIMADGTADHSKYRITLYPSNSVGDPILGPTPDINPASDVWGADNEFLTSAMGTRTDPMSTATLRMTRFSNPSGNSIPVTVGQRYWLCMSTEMYNPADGSVGWFSDPIGTYGGGFAYSMGAPFLDPETFLPTNKVDFGFTVFSQDVVVAPVVTPTTTTTPTTTPTTTTTTTTTTTAPAATTPAASAPLPTGVTVGTAAAPATPTASIKAPTAVTIADVAADQGGSLVLGWKASTTADIDGYKIFRSTEEKTNFKETVQTIKTILTYTDNTAVIGQKYYYMVRAYKGALESPSSTTVNSISVDNLAPVVPTNFTFAKKALDFSFAWSKNLEVDLAGYSILVVDPTDNTKVLETIEISKDLNSYELVIGNHAALATGVVYGFSLLAKDTSGNISEKSIATEKTVEAVAAVAAETPEEDTSNDNTKWYIISGIVALVLLGGGLYWFKFRKKVIV